MNDPAKTHRRLPAVRSPLEDLGDDEIFQAVDLGLDAVSTRPPVRAEDPTRGEETDPEPSLAPRPSDDAVPTPSVLDEVPTPRVVAVPAEPSSPPARRSARSRRPYVIVGLVTGGLVMTLALGGAALVVLTSPRAPQPLAEPAASPAAAKPSAPAQAAVTQTPSVPDPAASTSGPEVLAQAGAHAQAIQACVDALHGQAPEAAGRLVLGWVIRPSGRPAELRVVSGVPPNRAFVSCLEHEVRRWRFAPHAGGDLEAELPFSF